MSDRRAQIEARLRGVPGPWEDSTMWTGPDSLVHHAPDDLRWLLDALAAAEVAADGYRQRPEFARSEAERDAATAALERVRALANEWAEHPDWLRVHSEAVVAHLRRALDGEDSDQ